MRSTAGTAGPCSHPGRRIRPLPASPRAFAGVCRPTLRSRPPQGRPGPGLASRARAGRRSTCLSSTPIGGLERMGNWSVGVVVLLALATPFILLLALPRVAFSRSAAAYLAFLLQAADLHLHGPAAHSTGGAVLRAGGPRWGERLRHDQRASGEAALSSVQQLLFQQLLALPPGFSVDTAFGDRLLIDLSGVVRHEVNLYWGSAIHASSRHELFTAGPVAEADSPVRSTAGWPSWGYGLASRTNRVGDTTYLEMYAPLRVPGSPLGSGQLFLSMPLLAQQEEADRQPRRAAPARPAGDGRPLSPCWWPSAATWPATSPGRSCSWWKARAASPPVLPSLDLAPTELELGRPGGGGGRDGAQDRRCARAARARKKQVVERMVENITSGVVSLDRERRGAAHNRVAAELLGTAVGESLQEAVDRAERLGPDRGVPAQRRHRDGALDRAPAWRRRGLPRAASWSGRWSGCLCRERASLQRCWWSRTPTEVPPRPAPPRLGRDGADDRPRDQESTDSHPPVGRAHAWRSTVTIRSTSTASSNVAPTTSSPRWRSCAPSPPRFSAYSSIPRIDPQPADLVASVADLVEGYRAAPPPGVQVDFFAQPESLIVRFDAKLLGRAVRNLIENALRASSGGGRVVVRVDQESGLARIAVQDSGPRRSPGPPLPDLRSVLLDPCYRHRSRSPHCPPHRGGAWWRHDGLQPSGGRAGGDRDAAGVGVRDRGAKMTQIMDKKRERDVLANADQESAENRWISEVQIQRFKAAFKPDPILLSRFNVVIGRNGSGKSTLLEALQWLDVTIRRDAREACDRYYGIRDLINLRSQSEKPYFELSLTWSSESADSLPLRYEVRVEDREGTPRHSTRGAGCRAKGSRGSSATSTPAGMSGVIVSGANGNGVELAIREPDRLALGLLSSTKFARLDPALGFLEGFWSRAVFLRLSPNRLALGSLATRKSFEPLLDEEGQSLPALLNELTSEQRADLVEAVREILPGDSRCGGFSVRVGARHKGQLQSPRADAVPWSLGPEPVSHPSLDALGRHPPHYGDPRASSS